MPKQTAREYWRSTFAHAWRDTTFAKASRFIQTLITTVSAYYAQYKLGIRKGWDTMAIIGTIVGSYLLVMLLSFLWNLLCAPFRLAKDAAEREEILKQDLESCRNEIESFRSEKPPCSQGEIDIVALKFWQLQNGDKTVLGHFADGAQSTESELQQIFQMPSLYFLWLAKKTELFGLYPDGLWKSHPRHLAALKWYLKKNPLPPRDSINGLCFSAFSQQ